MHDPAPASSEPQAPQAHAQGQARSTTRSGSNIRFRASKACRRCNEKRVKCDASERGTPCTRCEERQEPDCRLIQSRRGIYVRKTARQKQNSNATRTEENDNTRSNGNHRDDHDTQRTRLPLAAVPTAPDITAVEQQAYPQPSSASLQHSFAATALTPPSPPRHPSARTSNLRQRPSNGPDLYPNAATTIAPEPAYATNSQSSAPIEHDTPSGNTNASHASSSYREVGWASMFDHLLEGHRKGEDVLDKCSINYLGESFPLAIVLNDLKGARTPVVHHPGPPCPNNAETSEPQGLLHPSDMRPEDIAFLEAKQAFTAPPTETLDALVDVFLKCVFSLYPIVNPQEFIAQHNSRRIPWMLLHAVCFASATYCPVQLLYRAGFTSRRQARWLFYSKAKALFDIGYEGNKLVVLQTAILMSLWGGGPNNQWNFYSWISTGVTIAETVGCHRSMGETNMKLQDRSLLKRLWWILVIRDASCAALVGRPFRVNLDHCDTDALTEEDFQYDPSSPDYLSSPHTRCAGIYQIHATKLTLILRRIITARFYPDCKRSYTPEPLREMLLAWRDQLPPMLQWSDNGGDHSSIFVSTLCILYNHHMILAHINCPPKHSLSGTAAPATQRITPDEISSVSAQVIATTSCTVVTKSETLTAPHEIFHGVLIAAVVFYMQTKTNQPMTTQLGMSGLTNCRMVLHAISETWDASSWIMQLIDNVLCAPVSGFREAEKDQMDGVGAFMGSGGVGMFDSNAFFPTGYDLWQGHSVLENLFDMSTNSAFNMPMTPGLGEQSDQTQWF